MRAPLRHLPAFVLAIGATLASANAAALPQEPDACFSAPVEGQKLRREGKLLEARERFASCGGKTCPTEIVEQCSRWANEVQSALPTVVLAARDATGRDLVDVRVSTDGSAPVRVSALALALDPGLHTFVFERTASLGGSKDAGVRRQALLREGEKNREVVAEFSDALPPPASTPVALSERPVPLATWVLGGVALVALASFAAVGAVAVSQRSDDHCDTGCAPSAKRDVEAKFIVADASLGVGIVALGVAGWTYLARPTLQRPVATAFDVRAVPGGGMAVLGASF